MNYIWGGIIVFSVIASIFLGKITELSSSIMDGAGAAVTLFLTIMSMMCLWSGISNIAEKAGLTAKLSKLLRPVLRLIFPRLEPESAAAQAISMNMTANILGLGNAATPLGLKAMSELKKRGGASLSATDEMATFIVVNTACIELVPTTVALLRHTYGSAEPMSIIVPVWLASISSFIVGIVSVKTLGRFFYRQR